MAHDEEIMDEDANPDDRRARASSLPWPG